VYEGVVAATGELPPWTLVIVDGKPARDPDKRLAR
jgi:hypothetical protein